MKVIRVLSCGYKYGEPPKGAVFALDCRTFDNPFYDETLRHLTGEDRAVQDFLESKEPVRQMLAALPALFGAILPGHMANDRYHPSELKIIFACMGGKHRSQFFARRSAEIIAALARDHPEWDCEIVVEHRDNGKE